MNVAWISDEEIIPFDNIECVVFDEMNDTPVCEVLLANTKETVRIAQKENVDRFRAEYVAYIHLMSKATLVLENIDG